MRFGRLASAAIVALLLSSGCNALFGIHDLSSSDASVADSGLHESGVRETGKQDTSVKDSGSGDSHADHNTQVCTPDLDAGVAPTETCTLDGWCWLSPGLPGYTLNAVSGVCGDVWAAGDGGVVLHRVGATWSVITGPGATDLEAVVRIANNDVWVGDVAGGLHHFDGTTWQSYSNSVTGASIAALWGSGTSDVWAAGAGASQGVLMHWDGAKWTHDPLEMETTGLTGLSGMASTDVWAAGDKLFHYDGSWSIVSGMPAGCTFPSIFADAPNEAWTICSEDDIEGSPDTGLTGSFNGVFLYHGSASTWAAVDAGIRVKGLGAAVPALVWGSGGSDVWMMGDLDTTPFPIVLAHYDGTSWVKTYTIPGVVDPFAASSTGPGESFVVGEPGAILHTVGVGTRYEDPVAGSAVAAIGGTGPSDVWLVGGAAGGQDAGINGLYYDGTKLTPRAIPGGAFATAIYISSNPELDDSGAPIPAPWVVGVDANDFPAAWSWDRTSSTWVRADGLPAEQETLWGVAGGSDGSLFAVGDGPSVYSHTGSSWTAVSFAPPDGGAVGSDSSLFAIAGNGRGTYWAVGTSGLVVSRQGGVWTSSVAPTPDALVTAAFDESSGDLWAAGVNASNTTDLFVLHAGAWTQVTAPNEPAMAPMPAPRLWIDNAGQVWLLGASGTIFSHESADGGAWTTVGLPAGFGTSALWGTAGSGSDDIWVGGLNTIRYYAK